MSQKYCPKWQKISDKVSGDKFFGHKKSFSRVSFLSLCCSCDFGRSLKEGLEMSMHCVHRVSLDRVQSISLSILTEKPGKKLAELDCGFAVLRYTENVISLGL